MKRNTRSDEARRPTRRAWSAPAIEDLAPLRELTLQSAIPGGEWGFSWLDSTNPTRPLG